MSHSLETEYRLKSFAQTWAPGLSQPVVCQWTLVSPVHSTAVNAGIHHFLGKAFLKHSIVLKQIE